MAYIKLNNPISGFDALLNTLLQDDVVARKNFKHNFLNTPAANIVETTNSFDIYMQVPGFTKEQIQVKVDNLILTVSGNKERKPLSEGSTLVQKEFSNRPFKRSFTISKNVDTNNIAAKYENGILTLTLPKTEKEKAEVKDISVS